MGTGEIINSAQVQKYRLKECSYHAKSVPVKLCWFCKVIQKIEAKCSHLNLQTPQ